MTQKRRSYTQEFKDAAVSLITEQGYKYSEAARNLDINVSLLRRWKSESEKIAQGTQVDEDLRKEVLRLRKENRRLQMEREVLKKAAAFFAKETEELA